MTTIKYTDGSHLMPYQADVRHFAELRDFSLQDLQSTLNKLKKIEVNRFIPYPCLHSTRNNREEECKKSDCKQRKIIHLYKDEDIGFILKEVIQSLSAILEKVKRNERGNIDITDIFNAWYFNRDIYLLQCGHRINAAKITDILDRQIDPYLTQRISSESRRYFGCFTCTDERIYKGNKIAIPNFGLRYVAEMLDELFQEVRIGHELPAPAVEEMEIPFDPTEFVNEYIETNHAETEKEVGQLVRNLSWHQLEDFCSCALESDKHSLMFYLFMSAAYLAKEEQSEDGDQFLINISYLLIEKLEANLPTTITPVTDPYVSTRIAENIFLLRIARESEVGSILKERFYEAANKVINSPYMIEGLTESSYRNLEFIIDKYPCIIDRLCGSTKDQESCVLAFERDCKIPISKFEGLTVLYAYTNFLDHQWPAQIQSKERQLQTGFHLHRLNSWLIDSIMDGTVRLDLSSANVRKAICIRLLSFSDENTLIDLRLLGILPLFKDVFSYPTAEDAELLQLWVARFLKQAQNPENIPNIFGILKEADQFVRSCAEKSKCNIEENYNLAWAEFYSKSKDMSNFKLSIQLYTSTVRNQSRKRVKEVALEILLTASTNNISLSFYEAERLMEPFIAFDKKQPDLGIHSYFLALKCCLRVMKHVNGDPSPYSLLEKLLRSTTPSALAHYLEYNREYRNLVSTFQNYFISFLNRLTKREASLLLDQMYGLIMLSGFVNDRALIDESLRDLIEKVFEADKHKQLSGDLRVTILKAMDSSIYKEFRGKWWKITGLILNN